MKTIANENAITNTLTNAKRKPARSSTKASQKVNVADITKREAEMDIIAREAKAVRDHKRIVDTQTRHLDTLVEIGQVIADVRSLYADDATFNKAVAKRKLNAIPYDGSCGRYVLMVLAQNWAQIQPLLGSEKKVGEQVFKFKSTSPDQLVRAYRSMVKAQGGDATTRKTSGKKPATKRSKSKSIKSGYTKAQIMQAMQLCVEAGVLVKADLAKIDWTKAPAKTGK